MFCKSLPYVHIKKLELLLSAAILYGMSADSNDSGKWFLSLLPWPAQILDCFRKGESYAKQALCYVID